MRAIWKGYITFGLVNVPISLYPATVKKELSFRLLRRSDLSPIVYKRVVAMGDAYDEPFKELMGLTMMWGYQMPIGEDLMKTRARVSARNRHTGFFNVVFCDGHVQHMKPGKLFGQDDAALMRLNNDHKPH